MNQLIIDQNRHAARRAGLAAGRSGVVLAALAAVVLLALPAPVHAQNSGGMLFYAAHYMCVFGDTEITVLSQPGWPDGIMAATYVHTTGQCLNTPLNKLYSPCTDSSVTGVVSCTGLPFNPNINVKMMPAGMLAVAQALYKDVNGTKQFCASLSSWNYSTIKSNLGFGSGIMGAQCGSGYYGVSSGVYAWDGTAWQGGWCWLGDVYLQ